MVVIAQRGPQRGQLLRHDVLVHRAKVDRPLTRYHRHSNLCGVAGKEHSDIAKVQLEPPLFLCAGKHGFGLCHIDRPQHRARGDKPGEVVGISLETGTVFQRLQLKALVLLVKLCWYGVIDRLDLKGAIARVLCDVLTIQAQEIHLHLPHRTKVIARIQALLHHLRHTADDKILPKEVDEKTMQGVIERGLLLIALSHLVENRLGNPPRPAELLEGEGSHVYAMQIAYRP